MKVPKNIGSIEFKAVLPPHLEDELILLINSWFPNKNYNLEVGMTKTTIIFKEDDEWVYKIPHNGIYIPISAGFNKESSQMYFSRLKENACEKERIFYSCLPSDNIKKYFLKIYKWKRLDGITLYVQNKVQILPEEAMDYGELPWYLKDKIKFDISTFWINRAIEKNGVDSVVDLVDYLNNNLDVTEDLSPSNLGIDKNGNPVIIDYSGFYSCVDEHKY